MSMAEYYQDQEMEAMANLDNEVARLEKEAQAKAFEKRTKEIIQQQMVIIKSEIIAARDKWWVDEMENLFNPRENWSDTAFDMWELHKESLEVNMDRLLSEQEIDSCQENNFYDRDGELSIPKLLAAQLLKADKEWLEWINKLPYEQFDKEGFPTENDSEVTQRMFLIGYETLKNRKQEIWL